MSTRIYSNRGIKLICLILCEICVCVLLRIYRIAHSNIRDICLLVHKYRPQFMDRTRLKNIPQNVERLSPISLDVVNGYIIHDLCGLLFYLNTLTFFMKLVTPETQITFEVSRYYLLDISVVPYGKRLSRSHL